MSSREAGESTRERGLGAPMLHSELLVGVAAPVGRCEQSQVEGGRRLHPGAEEQDVKRGH